MPPYAMTSEELKDAWGRKVFFLYPYSAFNEELLFEILTHEYEVFALKSHVTAWRISEKHPGSIIFVNIDDVLSEQEWESWVRKFMADPKRGQTKIGIITSNEDQDLARKYLMDISVPCGIIQLKEGLTKSKKTILKILEENKARGRRRYVRARCSELQRAMFNVKVGAKLGHGNILDISVAGMTFNFNKSLQLKPGAVLGDIQLKLKGIICRVSGTYVGETREGGLRNLLMFKQPVPPDTVNKIHRFIFSSLQQEMDSALGQGK
jgi:hypothetical protein